MRSWAGDNTRFISSRNSELESSTMRVYRHANPLSVPPVLLTDQPFPWKNVPLSRSENHPRNGMPFAPSSAPGCLDAAQANAEFRGSSTAGCSAISCWITS